MKLIEGITKAYSFYHSCLSPKKVGNDIECTHEVRLGYPTSLAATTNDHLKTLKL